MRSERIGGLGSVPASAKLAAVFLPLVLVAFPACINSDPVAPDMSTINVSADPATIGSGGSTKITATVRGSNGTRLPGQEVIFSTTQGTLKPPAQTSLTTDRNGQATSILTTTANATVTVRSGGTNGQVQVSVVNCNLSSITVNAADPNQLPIGTCSDKLTLVVVAKDSSGAGCPGVTVDVFDDAPPGGSGLVQLTGTLSPQSGVTDANGEFRTVFAVDPTNCSMNCASPNAGNCEDDVYAEDSSGNFVSPVLQLGENIP